MKSKSFPSIALAALATLVLKTLPAHGQVALPVPADINKYQASPALAGELVYKGETYALRAPAAAAPLYRYERRVLSSAETLSATHLTADPTGQLLIVETAIASPNYELQSLSMADRQSGYSGTVRVSQQGRHLEFQLEDKGKLSRASEDVSAPVVSGTTLFGFILSNREALKSGAVIPLRMIVMKDKTSYGFDLRFVEHKDQEQVFSLTPSNFLIRQVVQPLRVVFDARSKHPVRYEGRVPPKALVSGQLKDLDARVIYAPMAAAYR